jgi:hypothetical protein
MVNGMVILYDLNQFDGHASHRPVFLTNLDACHVSQAVVSNQLDNVIAEAKFALETISI